MIKTICGTFSPCVCVNRVNVHIVQIGLIVRASRDDHLWATERVLNQPAAVTPCPWVRYISHPISNVVKVIRTTQKSDS